MANIQSIGSHLGWVADDPTNDDDSTDYIWHLLGSDILNWG